MRSPADYFVALCYTLVSISLPSFLILHFFYTYKMRTQSRFEHWYYGLKSKRNCYQWYNQAQCVRRYIFAILITGC